MESNNVNLAPKWWEEGRCLITGGIISSYLHGRQSTKNKARSSKKPNWRKHEETN